MDNSDTKARLVRYTPPQTGRLGFLSLAGAASNSIPLPFLPGKTLSRIRGAVAYDVVKRHGLSLTSDARAIIATADSPSTNRAQVIGLANYVAGRFIRRFGPLWFLTPAISGLEVFALGHLLDRYLESHRTAHSVRLQASEARFVRKAIDQSVLRAISPRLEVPSGNPGQANQASADERDDATKMIDWALVSAASIPSYLVRRLEASFDDVVRQNRDQRRD